MEGYMVAIISLSGYRYRQVYTSATVAPIGVKYCMMVHIGPGQKVSPFGAVPSEDPKIPNFGPKFWPLNREYLENAKSQLWMCGKPTFCSDSVFKQQLSYRKQNNLAIANRSRISCAHNT